MGNAAPLCIDHVHLTDGAAFVEVQETRHRLGGRKPGAQQLQPVDAVERVDQRLGRDGADARLDMRDQGADSEEARGDPDADLSGFAILGDDGPGHMQPPGDKLRQ